jgi:hypothetical protein
MSESTPDIPDEIVGPERTLLQMFKLFVEPEVKRRHLNGSLSDPSLVKAAQVLFFEGRVPEVRLNKEITFSVRARAPRAFQDDEPISLAEIAPHIEATDLEIAPVQGGRRQSVRLFAPRACE